MENYDYFEKKEYIKGGVIAQNLNGFIVLVVDNIRLLFNSLKCMVRGHIPVAYYSTDGKRLIHTNRCARCYRYKGLGRMGWEDIPVPVLPGETPITREEWETFARDVEHAIKLYSAVKGKEYLIIDVQNRIDRIMLDRVGLGILTSPLALPPEFWDSYRGG